MHFIGVIARAVQSFHTCHQYTDILDVWFIVDIQSPLAVVWMDMPLNEELQGWSQYD